MFGPMRSERIDIGMRRRRRLRMAIEGGLAPTPTEPARLSFEWRWMIRGHTFAEWVTEAGVLLVVFGALGGWC